MAAARIKLGLQEKLYMGNLDAARDWGFAKDCVEAMWLMLQEDNPDDYVIATGRSHSVRSFCKAAFDEVSIPLTWTGEGVEEKGVDANSGRVIIEVDPDYFRPTEVDFLIGDATKAQKKLGWKPRVAFEELVKMMDAADLEKEKNKEWPELNKPIAMEL